MGNERHTAINLTVEFGNMALRKWNLRWVLRDE